MERRKLTFYTSFERSGPKDSVHVFSFVFAQLGTEILQIMWFWQKAELRKMHNFYFAEKHLISTAASFSTI